MYHILYLVGMLRAHATLQTGPDWNDQVKSIILKNVF